MDIASLGAHARSYLMPDLGEQSSPRGRADADGAAAEPDASSAAGGICGYSADGTTAAPSSRIGRIDVYA